MSDLPVLPPIEPAESIPAALAAPKPKKVRAAEPFVPAPATFDDTTHLIAAPASTYEETTMATTIENMTADTTAKTHDFAADMTGRAQDAMAKTQAMFGDWTSFTKGNVEAMIESGKLAAAGMQTMAQEQAALVRKHFEEATAAARTMASVKSPTEFMKLQNDFVRQQFDGMVSETSQTTEKMLKLVGEVVQPVANRVALAVEKVKQAA